MYTNHLYTHVYFDTRFKSIPGTDAYGYYRISIVGTVAIIYSVYDDEVEMWWDATLRKAYDLTIDGAEARLLKLARRLGVWGKSLEELTKFLDMCEEERREHFLVSWEKG